MGDRKVASRTLQPPVLDLKISLEGIPPAGHQAAITMPDETRAELAARYGLLGVAVWEAEADVTRTRDGAHVVGEVRAEVSAACVVTLRPVTQSISERFDIQFVREGTEAEQPEAALLPEGQDPPEIMTSGAIDLGGLFEEHFVLALDPYPRAEDAEIPAEFQSDANAGGPTTFAALAVLRGQNLAGQKPVKPKD